MKDLPKPCLFCGFLGRFQKVHVCPSCWTLVHTSNMFQVGTRRITSLMMLKVSCNRQSNLQEQPIEHPFPQQSLYLPMQDKKNVPPLGLKPTKK